MPVFLGSRSLDVLLALVERSGEVVSKAQILDAVWSGAAVEEFNLTVQISAVRRAIDHGRVGPSLIRTIHGRGYLFAGEVTQEVTPPPSNVSPAGRGGNRPANGMPKLPRTRTAVDKADAAEERFEQRTPELRQLTVMSCEVVELAVLSVKFDLEDLRQVTTAYHLCCGEIIEKHYGCVANYTSAGVLAYFGYPEASEHDVEHAVRAGFALIDAITELSTSARTPLHGRVGVATGLVAAGDPAGLDAAQTVTIVGETPNLAVHLQTLAQPNMVLVSQTTRSHLGRAGPIAESLAQFKSGVCRSKSRLGRYI